MPVEKSRRTAFVLATLVSATALGAQPAAAFAKPALVAHKSVTWSGVQARRDGDAFFSARRLGSFAAAPRGVNEGTCDVGDNPMIC
jgi:Spy/CpxP family protein refolding chaperone